MNKEERRERAFERILRIMDKHDISLDDLNEAEL